MDHRALTRRRCLVPAVIALACLAAPAIAGAHLRSGTVAVDYQASVRRPHTSAYAIQIFQSDRALGITLKRGHTIVLLGYLGEPVFRLDAAGLWVNAASPTAAADRLVSKPERVAASTPHWRLQRGRHSLVWHDARVQGLPAGVSDGAWSVPLVVDGRHTRLTGELHRYPAPQLWPWLALLAAVLSAAAVPPLAGRVNVARTVAIGLALASVIAALVLTLAFVLDAYASPGTWILSVDGIAFLGVGIGILLRGPRHWHVGAAIGLGLLALGMALSKGAVFFHPIALAIVPATSMRWATVIAIGTGCGAAAVGCWIYTQAPGQATERDHAATPAPRMLPEWPTG